MTKANSTQICWAYEDTYRTAALDEAGDTGFRFGDYGESISKWQSPAIENVVERYRIYSENYPRFVDGGRTFPKWKHAFNPATAQFAVFMLGKTESGTPNTFSPHAVDAVKKSLTVRWQEQGGSNDRVVQAVGAYPVELYCRAAIGSPLAAELTFMFSDFEDDGDSRPVLDSSPGLPAGVEQVYDGAPVVTYDYGGGSEAVLTDVLQAEWRVKQEHELVPDDDRQGQAVYLYGFEAAELILTAVMEDDSKWDDFIDFAERDYAVKVRKPDGDDYVETILRNCRPITAKKTSKPYRGLVTTKLILKAEYLEGEYTFDGSGTWSDHFKTAT
jgi:hypothetical protein